LPEGGEQVVIQRGRGTVRQQQIISAAKKLIVKYGSEHVTVKKMAREIGVSEAAIYRHFSSKKEILSFLLDDLEVTLLAGLEIENEADPLAVIEKSLLNQISDSERRKGMAFLVIAEIISLGDRKLKKKAYQVILKFLENLQNLLSRAKESGSIRQEIDSAALARLLFGMMQGLITIWTLSHYNLHLEKDFRYLWDLIRESVFK